MLPATVTLLIIFCTGFLILRGQQTQVVLVCSGLLLLSLAILVEKTQGPPAQTQTIGQAWQIIPWLLEKIFSPRFMDLALVVMSVGGYAKYMSHIGAADAMVRVTTRPLARLDSPYLTLSLVYLMGQILNLFIPSAAGLAMLLLVVVYPTLIGTGVSPASAGAVIGTTACLDLGPLSGTTIVAASTSELSVTTYFFFHQLPIAIFTALAIAALHYPVMKYFDARDEKYPIATKANTSTHTGTDALEAPVSYSLLPILPLLLLVIFSDLVISGTRLHVGSAVFISLSIVLLTEANRKRNLKTLALGLQAFTAGMWKMFRTVVTLIIAAEVFAAGIWSTGILHTMLQSAQQIRGAPFVMTLVLISITGGIAFLSGSGSAAFISFSSLVHKIAPILDVKTVSLVLPMQLAAGIFRSVSPVAGVIIAVAGTAEVSPFEIIKRTSLPMAGGLAAMLLSSWLYY